jgi:hypothetical protein
MPAPLSTPRVPLGFPSLAAAGDQTAGTGSPTAPGIEASGHIVSLGGSTAPEIEAGNSTTSPDGQSAPVLRLAV